MLYRSIIQFMYEWVAHQITCRRDKFSHLWAFEFLVSMFRGLLELYNICFINDSRFVPFYGQKLIEKILGTLPEYEHNPGKYVQFLWNERDSSTFLCTLFYFYFCWFLINLPICSNDMRFSVYAFKIENIPEQSHFWVIPSALTHNSVLWQRAVVYFILRLVIPQVIKRIVRLLVFVLIVKIVMTVTEKMAKYPWKYQSKHLDNCTNVSVIFCGCCYLKVPRSTSCPLNLMWIPSFNKLP